MREIRLLARKMSGLKDSEPKSPKRGRVIHAAAILLGENSNKKPRSTTIVGSRYTNENALACSFVVGENVFVGTRHRDPHSTQRFSKNTPPPPVPGFHRAAAPLPLSHVSMMHPTGKSLTVIAVLRILLTYWDNRHRCMTPCRRRARKKAT